MLYMGNVVIHPAIKFSTDEPVILVVNLLMQILQSSDNGLIVLKLVPILEGDHKEPDKQL